MNIEKKAMCLLFMHMFKLAPGASQIAVNIEGAWDERSTCDRTERCWTLKLPTRDTCLEDEGSEGRLSAFDNRNLKTLVKETPCKSLRETIVCSMLHIKNSIDSFFDRTPACDKKETFYENFNRSA